MQPWLIAAAAALGAGLIAFLSAALRLRWPVAVLSLLLAAIATQLFLAARGNGAYHDLAALRAQMFTTVPALAGIAAGLALAAARGIAPIRRDLPGAAVVLGLLVALAAVVSGLLL
ncbi:hypothetical protein [Paracoccus spongiarum]|uniref:Uncharacterized protein n=1 Tax=Paracoccus spongiarum TaxID=3064387 RepID=A0ABT9J6X2_9RHOB|nr:hypothetical protein [Paracoccus sp. 2205BS29-5]MDP5305548.1 hypothetical protein [Paracoccus sp. 2205BS29-5]